MRLHRLFLDTSLLPSSTSPTRISPRRPSRCGRSHATPGSPCRPIRRPSAWRSRGEITAGGLLPSVDLLRGRHRRRRLLRARREQPRGGRAAEKRDELATLHHSIPSSARASRVVGTLRPMPLLGGRLILDDQAEQEMHVGAVGSAFRRLGSMGSPHLAQTPYVPSVIRFRAASI